MMNTRKIASEYRLSHWSDIVRKRTEIGCTVKAFCESEGIHPNSYYYWQRKLRESVCESISASDTSSTTTAWALAVAPNPIAREISQMLPIEIGKCRIFAGIDTDERLLSKVCKILSSLC
jgi:transposase-like protein